MKTSRLLHHKDDLTRLLPFVVGHVDYIPTALRAFRTLKKERGNPEIRINHKITNPFPNENERNDLTERADWLLDMVLVNPQKLIDSMPEIIGRLYQGQWAIYACTMTVVALYNIIRIYPDLKDRYISKVPELIDLLMTEEVKYYDTMEWREDPLSSLEGNKSHMTYLSLLAWSMSCYNLVGGDDRYEVLFKSICATLARRMLNSSDLNLPSFPNNIIFLPDMMVAIIALKNYSIIYDSQYDELVKQWIQNAKRLWIDNKTGLLISQYYPNGRRSKLQGSYSALNCTYLTMIDEEFALSQYMQLKQYFMIQDNYPSIKEYIHKSPTFGFHIDAGPIIDGRSPTGTAFAMGAATYFGDWSIRQGLLKTAELAGNTIKKNGKRHYKLAEIMLTGEAITLAMRTNMNFLTNKSPNQK